VSLRISQRQQRFASLGGFRDALHRHDLAEGLRPTHVSLSEVLWWTTAVEDDLRNADPTYDTARAADPRAVALPGIRYVRNFATHHAVAVTEVGAGGLTIPFTIPFTIPTERMYWLPFDELPKPTSKTPKKYLDEQQASCREHMEGRRTVDVLDVAGTWLEARMGRLLAVPDASEPVTPEMQKWFEKYRRDSPQP